ncbi:hypothetical protein [Pseudomonas asiatica]
MTFRWCVALVWIWYLALAIKCCRHNPVPLARLADSRYQVTVTMQNTNDLHDVLAVSASCTCMTA